MNALKASKQSSEYASRAGDKLASVADLFNLNFNNKVILDVGSSTGGFTDFSLQRGAKKVLAVDVGTNQMHPRLLGNSKIELHEKTDIRDFSTNQIMDIVLIDVSFISLTEILPAVAKLINNKTQVVAMAKPQFEAQDNFKNKGIIKNEKLRRDTLKQLEARIKNLFVVLEKADSQVAGLKGNRERFYLLKSL